MIRSRRIFSVLLAGFGLLLSLALVNVAPPKAEAIKLEPGCWISAPPSAGASPEWRKSDCSALKELYPSFNPDNFSCYLSWGTVYGPTPPVRAATCYGNDDTDIPQPTAPPRYPVENKPGNPAQIVITPDVPHCFSESPDTGYRQRACPEGAWLEPGKCYIILSSGTAQHRECSSIQNTVLEGTSDTPGLQDPAKEPLPEATADTCGDANIRQVKLSIKIGCQQRYNPIIDMLFAVLRFASVGAGIVCIASAIAGAIQFSTSGGNPKAASDAIKRIASSAGALIFFLFIYVILNWIIPGGLLVSP